MRPSIALLAWVLAFAVVGGLTYWREAQKREEAALQAKVEPQELDEVIACKAREDAERLAVAFNKTTELAKALEDPKSEAAALSQRLLIAGRCAHFEHQVRFMPVAVLFDGSSFAPVLATPYNVIEADMDMAEGIGRLFLVTEWRPETSLPVPRKDQTPATPS